MARILNISIFVVFNYHLILADFSYPWLFQELSLSVLFAYIIGFIPALLAGFLICAGRLRDGGAGFSYAVLIGTLVGLVTGVMAIEILEPR